MRKPDAALDINTIQKRADGINRWLKENGADCLRQQRHLDENSNERVYWHYGYMVALRDVLRFLCGNRFGLNPKRSPSDTPNKSSVA